MYSTHDLARTVVRDRQVRYERAASTRRLLGTLRRRFDRPTVTAEQAGAASVPIALGRTPNAIEHRAA